MAKQKETKLATVHQIDRHKFDFPAKNKHTIFLFTVNMVCFLLAFGLGDAQLFFLQKKGRLKTRINVIKIHLLTPSLDFYASSYCTGCSQ